MSQTGHTSEEIFEILKNEILTLQLKPDETLGENRMCERFGVSRTPIRAVLRRLESYGLVEIIPYKGTVITLIDFEEVKQIIYMRAAVEIMVLKDFVDVCTPMIMEKMRYIIRKQRIIVEDGASIEDFYKLDSQLHEVWFKETDKMYLWNLIQESQVQYTRFRMLDILQPQHMCKIIEEHEYLFTLAENKDKAGIEACIAGHLYGGVERVSRKIETDCAAYFVKHEETTNKK